MDLSFAIPRTPSKLLSNYIWIATCRKDEDKQKEADILKIELLAFGRDVSTAGLH